jgi:cytosine/adenosine deaminase-related metal-dependent hydrolase
MSTVTLPDIACPVHVIRVRARWIVPVNQAPIHGGALHLRGDLIEYLGPSQGSEIDLGDVALLPGWVNVHTHLDLSDCREPLGRPGESLPQWIGRVIAHRRNRSAAAEFQAVAQGLRELKCCGTRLFADIVGSVPAAHALAGPSSDSKPYPEPILIAETLGLSADRQVESWNQLLEIQQIAVDSGLEFGISPHAPYSLTTQVLQNACALAEQTHSLVAMHLAESDAEAELLEGGTGEFRQRLEAIGVWREGIFPRPNAIPEIFAQLARAPAGLVVHGNFLTAEHIRTLSQYPQLTVVHCPRTHARFGYPTHPIAQFLQAGIRVALGTDSRATNPDLDLWGEVRWLLDHRADLSPESIIRCATWSGANALRRSDCGRLAAGIRPGILKIPVSRCDNAYLAIAEHHGTPTPLQ